MIAAKAKERQIEGGKEKVPLNSVEAKPWKAETNSIIAKAVGISRDTIRKASVIAEKAPEEVKERLRAGGASFADT